MSKDGFITKINTFLGFPFRPQDEFEALKDKADIALQMEEAKTMPDALHCPRCGTGYASGRGYNAEKGRCDACGYREVRGAV